MSPRSSLLWTLVIPCVASGLSHWLAYAFELSFIVIRIACLVSLILVYVYG